MGGDGRGIIDWVGQFKALKRTAIIFAVSLETHWRGGGTPEESTRQSWAGMKKDCKRLERFRRGGRNGGEPRRDFIKRVPWGRQQCSFIQVRECSAPMIAFAWG